MKKLNLAIVLVVLAPVLCVHGAAQDPIGPDESGDSSHTVVPQSSIESTLPPCTATTQNSTEVVTLDEYLEHWVSVTEELEKRQDQGRAVVAKFVCAGDTEGFVVRRYPDGSFSCYRWGDGIGDPHTPSLNLKKEMTDAQFEAELSNKLRMRVTYLPMAAR